MVVARMVTVVLRLMGWKKVAAEAKLTGGDTSSEQADSLSGANATVGK